MPPLVGVGMQACCIAMALSSALGEHPPLRTARLWPQSAASSQVNERTDVPHSPVLLHPAQALHVWWRMEK